MDCKPKVHNSEIECPCFESSTNSATDKTHSRTTKEVPSVSIFIYSLEDLLWDGRRL